MRSNHKPLVTRSHMFSRAWRHVITSSWLVDFIICVLCDCPSNFFDFEILNDRQLKTALIKHKLLKTTFYDSIAK